jgi:hypothetical protein
MRVREGKGARDLKWKMMQSMALVKVARVVRSARWDVSGQLHVVEKEGAEHSAVRCVPPITLLLISQACIQRTEVMCSGCTVWFSLHLLILVQMMEASQKSRCDTG